MKTYEFVAILNLEKFTPQAIGAITKNFKKYNVEITNIEKWGDRLLAYPIKKDNKKHNRGFYILYHFKANPDIMDKLIAKIENNSNILKFVVCDTTDKWND